MSVERLIAEKLRYHKNHISTLNPILFDEDDNLIPKVREKLLKIVDEFLEYIQVDIRVLDVRLVGSNASYNYNPDSDIDLHIVTNLSEISEPDTIARLFFDSVKKNFKDSYNIKIKGTDVELYVEDVNASSVSNGIYSVTSDAWIKSPAPMQDPSSDELADAEEIEEEIIRQIKSCETAEELQAVVDKLYIIRKDSLSKYGETGAGNLAFKSLRGKGVLENIKDVLRSATSRELSLESKSINESEEWEGAHPADDDLFHANADRLGLEVKEDILKVSGRELEFDYVVLKSPTLFYHSTTKDRVASIRSQGLTPQVQARGKYISGIFLSGVHDSASKWRGDNTVVLKVLLPAGTRVYQDRQSNAVFVRNRITKESIL